MDEQKKLREALAKIAQIANETLEQGDGRGTDSPNEESGGRYSGELSIGCSIKALPARLQKKSADNAIKINPFNTPVIGSLIEGSVTIADPQFLTVITSKYWGRTPRRLTVSFMETTTADLRARIVSHMNAWNKSEGISFVETTGVGQVRISRTGAGYWSYLGTDILLIPKNRPTMNLQGFSMSTPESEYKRVVRHETGHTLGFPHEHMRKELVARIDPTKAYDYFRRTQGWDKATVDQQVLTPLDDRTILGTAPDQTSIMCYQLPAAITRDGQPIIGGLDINATDYAFAASIYPKTAFAVAKAQSQQQQDEDWSYSDDVEDEEIEQTVQQTILQPNGAGA